MGFTLKISKVCFYFINYVLSTKIMFEIILDYVFFMYEQFLFMWTELCLVKMIDMYVMY